VLLTGLRGAPKSREAFEAAATAQIKYSIEAEAVNKKVKKLGKILFQINFKELFIHICKKIIE
jgi:hypothetical protein